MYKSLTMCTWVQTCAWVCMYVWLRLLCPNLLRHKRSKRYSRFRHNVVQYHRVLTHDDVIKWKYFPRYWPFVRGIHRSPVNSPHKGQWRGALMFSLICVWINGWVNNREAGDLRCYRAHYDVTVMRSNHNDTKSEAKSTFKQHASKRLSLRKNTKEIPVGCKAGTIWLVLKNICKKHLHSVCAE